MRFDDTEVEKQYRQDTRALLRWGDLRWLALSFFASQIGLAKSQVQASSPGLTITLLCCYRLVQFVRLGMLISALCLPNEVYGSWRLVMLRVLRIVRMAMYVCVLLSPPSLIIPPEFSGSCHTIKIFLWDALANHITFAINMPSEVAWDQLLLSSASICIVTATMVSKGMHCDTLEGRATWQRTHVEVCEGYLQWMQFPLSVVTDATHSMVSPLLGNLAQAPFMESTVGSVVGHIALPTFMDSPCKQFTLFYMMLTSLGTSIWAYHVERSKRFAWLQQPGRQHFRKYKESVATWRPALNVLVLITLAPLFCTAMLTAIC